MRRRGESSPAGMIRRAALNASGKSTIAERRAIAASVSGGPVAKVPAPPVTSAAPHQPLAVDPFGPTEQRKITHAKIAESVFTLSDGTKLVIKPVVGDVRRATGQFNENGEPLYFLALGQMLTTKAPEKLLRKTPKMARNPKRSRRKP
jgi:hypothetical protein